MNVTDPPFMNTSGTFGPVPAGVFSTSTNSWFHHPKIDKMGSNDTLVYHNNGPWRVTGHLAGMRSFETWAQARAYALTEPTLEWESGYCPNVGQMCNCIGTCQPKRTWKAVGYP